MYRPDKHIYLGGSYTDIKSISTNSTLLNSDNRESIHYENVNTINSRLNTLVNNNNSSLSTISANIAYLEYLYTKQYNSSISSYQEKEGKQIEYDAAKNTLSTISTQKTNYYNTYSTAIALFSSIYMDANMSIMKQYSTIEQMIKTKGTAEEYSYFDQNRHSQFGGGIMNISTILDRIIQKQYDDYSDAVITSTQRSTDIKTIEGRLSSLTQSLIPSSLNTVSTLSSLKRADLNAYYEEFYRISTANITLKAINQQIASTISTRDTANEYIISNSIVEAEAAIASDDTRKMYISSLKYELDTYVPYNSTILTMKAIENMYNLVINNLDVPTELSNYIGANIFAGGGPYNPLFVVSSIVCAPGDTECIRKRDSLNRYILMYYTLSSALPRYEDRYEKGRQARIDAEQYTTIRLQQIVDTMDSDYNKMTDETLADIRSYQNLLVEKQNELSRLQQIYSSSVLEISTSVFTPEENAYMTEFETQIGGSTDNTGNQIRRIRKAIYSRRAIETRYEESLKAYSSIVNSNVSTQTNLENIYITALKEQQIMTYRSEIRAAVIDQKERELNIERESKSILQEKLNTLEYESTIITRAISSFNSYTISGTVVSKSLSDRNTSLNEFEATNTTLTNEISTSMSLEINTYLNKIQTISSYVMYDIATKAINDTYRSDYNPQVNTNSKIISLYSHLSNIENYIELLKEEQLKYYEYIKAKKDYEKASATILNSSDPANTISNDVYAQLQFKYDVSIAEVNRMIDRRKTNDVEFNRTIMLQLLNDNPPLLEGETKLNITRTEQIDFINYNGSDIKIPKTYKTTNSGVGIIINDAISNTAFGKITYDSTTGDIFVFNLNTLWLQKLSSDLSAVNDYCNFSNASDDTKSNSQLYIKAHNGVVYGVDYVQSELYSITSYNTKTKVNTTVGSVNMLNRPIGIEVRHPQIYILNSDGENIVIRINITTGNIETVLSTANTNIGSYTPIKGIAVNLNSSKIYLNCGSRRVIGFNIENIPITGTTIDIIGSTETGYVDANGTNARFNNITDMCINSDNRLYLTDFENRAIRTIDVITKDVRTYTSGSSIRTNTPTTYTLGMTIPAKSIRCPTSNGNILNNYIENLYSLCITPDSILCVSYNFGNYNDNVVNNALPYRKSAVTNTSISFIPFDDKFKASYFSLTPKQINSFNIIRRDIPSIYPYTMEYKYINTNTDIFNKYSKYIPSKTITCISTNVVSGAATDALVIPTPTTTLDTVQYGTKCRYIEIRKTDRFEIFQLIILDKNGKNIGFKKDIRIMPKNNDIYRCNDANYDARSILDGRYDRTVNATPFQFWTNCMPDVQYLRIDLGAVFDVTAIIYLKKWSAWNSVGLTISLFDESNTKVTSDKIIQINNLETTIDLRNPNLPSSQRNLVPISLRATRYGVCGTIGRYVKLSKADNPAQSWFRFRVSQISVIAPDGTNLALNKSAIRNISGNQTSTPFIVNGKYMSFPPGPNTFTHDTTDPNYYLSDHIMIDLGGEYDIAAVNIYYSSDVNETAQGRITILTEDNLVAQEKVTSSKNAGKEILDFRFAGAPNCYTTVKWENHYGVAGIKARYIRLKKNGTMSFSKVEVVDKTGLDIAQDCNVSVNGEAVNGGDLTSMTIRQRNANSNILGIRRKEQGYFSANAYTSYTIDFGIVKEVCNIRLYGCSDADEMNGIQIELLINLSSTTPYTVATISGNDKTQSFDTRYEPTVSQYPTTVTRIYTRTGPYGIYAQYIYLHNIYVTTTLVNSSNILITDANGSRITPILVVIQEGLIIFKLARNYEITSVGYPSSITGFNDIALYDCNSILVAIRATNNMTYNSLTYKYADFRIFNVALNRLNDYAPIMPYDLKRGGYSLANAFNLSGQTGFSSVGVKARYIKIIPRNSTTPLYISQIIAVDEFGINRAFEKQTYQQLSSNPFPTNGKNAVDGLYEATFDTTEFLSLYFRKYKQKSTQASYDSSLSANAGSMFFAIDLGLDTVTNISYMDASKGKEYSINSIIYVASEGKGPEADGVIVELFDDRLQRVGSQTVTYMTSVFGLDILDFRVDTTVDYNSSPNRIEVRRREVRTGNNGAVLIQYIRIEQTDSTKQIELSQVIITDFTGMNIAMYQPTFSTSGNDTSYLIVDGATYTKTRATAFKTTGSESYKYVEINLGEERELNEIHIADIYEKSDGYNTLRIRLYNKHRDVIGSYKTYIETAINAALGVTDQTSIGSIAGVSFSDGFLYLQKIGVKAADSLIAYKNSVGLVPDAAVKDSTEDTSVPDVLRPSISGNSNVNMQPRFTRSADGGIPTRYVRLYNVNNHIQVSQLMIYNTAGVNVAYRTDLPVSQRKLPYATSTLPNKYAYYAVDGYCGYFHAARDESNCFISGNNRYDYLEIDLVTLQNIIAVRYIGPNGRNYSRTLGTRVQLLDENRIIMSELIVNKYVDCTLDFRQYSFNMPTIYNYISPIINTLYLHNTIYMRTLYISYTNSETTGARYFDLFTKKFYEITINNANRTVTSNNGYTVLDIIEPTSMHELQDGMVYIVDYTRNKVYTFDRGWSFANNWGINEIITSGLTNPYSITIGSADSSQNRKLFVSEYRVSGNIYRYNKRGNVISNMTTVYTANYIMGISVNQITGDLYACVQSTKCIMKIPADGSAATVFAGPTATGTGGTYKIPLESPCAILISTISNGPITADNQVIFIADDKTNMIYAITTGSRFGTLYTIAGIGSPGYTGDGSSGKNAKLNMSFPSLHYDNINGYLYFLDTNNKAIRTINILQKPINTTIYGLEPTTTLTPLFTTTTIPGIDVAIGDNNVAMFNFAEQNIKSLITPYNMKDTTIVNRIPNSIYKVYAPNRDIYSICMRKSDEYIYIYMRNSSSNININGRNSNGGIYRASIISGSLVLDRYYQNTLVADSEIYSMITTQDTENRMKLYLTASNRLIYSYTFGQSTIVTRVLGVNGNGTHTADGPILSTTSIQPYGISFNKVDNLLYFTEIFHNCGLVRRINGTKLETVVGTYFTTAGSDEPLIYPLSDFIKAKINPLTIRIISPQSIIHDNLGNLYIADHYTHSIHRLTRENMLEPVCGPFSISSNTEYLHKYGIKNQTYNAYSVKIQNPKSITFDSDMNLICTSISGHLYRISRLNELEPVVEIIMGGVNDNTSNYLDIIRSSNSYIFNPRSVLYSYLDNSLYFIELYESKYSITKVQPKYNKVLFNGAGTIIPYGYFKEVTPYLTNNITSSYNNMCINNNNILYYTEEIDNREAIVKYISLAAYSVKNTMRQYTTNIYKQTLIFDTGYAFGKMTYDPITKDIFVFNYNTLWLQKVSSNLTTVTNYCDFNNTPDSLSNSRLYIRAYNGIVYAVDYTQSELYAVTSSNNKTKLNTTVNSENMLNKPVGIELRYPYLFIINSLGTTAIIRYNINTTYIDIVARRSSSSPIGNTAAGYNITDVGGITVNTDATKIYIVDKKCRIVCFNLNIPISVAPSKTYGADSNGGCVDGIGINARFSNITDICMDSNDNIFVTESYDNHSIRKIDTKTDVVTTYTTGTIYTSTSPQIPSNYVNNLNYKYTLGGTIHTTNFLTVAPSTPNNDIDSKYMLYPFSLCITPTSILCSFYNFINNDNDTVSGSECKRKNKTRNTSIASFPYIDLVVNNAIQNTALGKITYDSITGDIFIFNLNTLWLQKVSSDLKTVTDFCDFNHTNENLSNSRLYIRAYNGNVYGVDYMQSELYSVNREGIKTRLNTMVNSENMLNRPIGIEFRYPYIYILNSESDNIVIRFPITSGTIETVISRNTIASYMPINGIVINAKSEIIYLNSGSTRVIGFNMENIPITGSPSDIIGGTEAGYIDGSYVNPSNPSTRSFRENVRFKNITDMCMDLGYMIYVTDSGNNNVIRRIDTTDRNNAVTTYTSGIEKEGRATYTLGTTVQARTIIAPSITNPPVSGTPEANIGWNNGTASCSNFCNASGWFGTQEPDYNGAKCVSVSVNGYPNITGCDVRPIDVTGNLVATTCRCQKSDLGWDPVIHDRYMQNLYSLCVTPTAILSVSYNFGSSQNANTVDGSVSKRKLAINNTSISAFPLEETDKEIKLILYKQSPIVLYDNIYLLMIRDSSNLIIYNTILGKDTVIKGLGDEASHIKSMCVHTNGFLFFCHADRVRHLNIKSTSPNYDVFIDEGKSYRHVSIDSINNRLYVTRTEDREGHRLSGQIYRFIDRYDLTFGNNTVTRTNKITWTLASTTENIQSITTYNDTTLIAVGRNIYKLANNGATTSLVKMYGTSTFSQLPGSSYNSYFYPINTITYSNNGNLYIADSNPTSTKRIIERKIVESMEPNKIYTLIGYPEPITDNTSSDSISQMYLDNPTGTAFDMYGNIYVCDAKSVIRINKNDGTIVTVCNNDSIRNIVDVQVNKSGYVYILTNTMLYRCLETSQNVYSNPEAITSTIATSTTLPTSGLGIVALSVRIRDARTMRFDSNDNLYIIESYKITNDLNNLIQSATTATSISEYNTICTKLYGKINPTNDDMNVGSFPGGTSKTDYDKGIQLFGINGSIDSPSSTSLKGLYNTALNNRDKNRADKISLETIRDKLNSIYDILSQNQFDFLFPNRDTSDINALIARWAKLDCGYNSLKQKSYFRETYYYHPPGNNRIQLIYYEIKGYNTEQIHPESKTIIKYIRDVQPLIDTIISTIERPESSELKGRLYGNSIFYNFINNNDSRLNTELIVNIQRIADEIYDPHTGKFVNPDIKTFPGSVFIKSHDLLSSAVFSVFSIEMANRTYISGKMQELVNTIKIYFDNLVKKILVTRDAINSLISTYDSEYNTLNSTLTTRRTTYETEYIQRYGTGGTDATPTGGTRKTYLDDLNTFYLKKANLTRGLETAVPTDSQLKVALQYRYNRILKIDKYNRVISVDSSYFYECTGIAFDSDNRMFLIDHYDKKLYMIKTDGNRYNLDLTPYGIPYGIAVDNNANMLERNIFISFNKWDISYNINALKGHHITNYQYTDNTITSNSVPKYTIGQINMEATPTDYIKYYGTHKYNEIRLKNPGLISIDSSNRMIFTQTGLHNVLIAFIASENRILFTQTKGIITYNVKTIRIEPSAIGNGMSLKRIRIDVATLVDSTNIDISSTSFEASRYTVNDSTTNIFPYTPTASQKQYISIKLNGASTITVKNIRLYADSNTTGSWVHVGNENDGVSVPAGTLVRYGATNRWIEETAGWESITVNNHYFNYDPAPRQVKTLQKFVPSTQATFDNTCAIGMNVILYDSNGNIISNRKTTNDILNRTGCLLNYESLTESDEYISQ